MGRVNRCVPPDYAGQVRTVGQTGHAQKKIVSVFLTKTYQTGHSGRDQFVPTNSSADNDLANLGTKSAPETKRGLQTLQAETARGDLTAVYGNLLADFTSHEVARGRPARAVKVAAGRARWFTRFLLDVGLAPDSITITVAREYLGVLYTATGRDGMPYQPKTVESYRDAAGQLCGYLVRCRRLAYNPFDYIKRKHVPKRLPREVPKPADLAKLLTYLAAWDQHEAPAHLTARWFMAHVVAELQYASGLRIGEVAALTPDHLDLDKRLVYVHEGKAGRSRLAYLSHYAVGLLRIYLDLRPLLLTARNDPADPRLFAVDVDALSRAQHRYLAKAAQATGVRMHTHTFRHAAGYHLLRAGCPLRVIQEILGHVQIKDTEVYTKLDIEDVRTAIDRFHPLGLAR